MKSITTYKIDNKSVSKTEFEAFLATLKEIPHTWFCDENDEGGETGYDAEDECGQKYEYRAISGDKISEHKITKISELPDIL